MDKFIEVVRALVRPAITIAFTAAVVFGLVMGRIAWGEFLMIYGPIIGFWFGEKSALKRQN
jgi:hypothetical protein